MDISSLCAKQREFNANGQPYRIEFRIAALRNLQRSIHDHENEINAALKNDLGKSVFESYMTETGMVLAELTYMLKHIRSYAKIKRRSAPLTQFPAKNFIIPEPYGMVLIMSPWNYPFMLTMTPLIDAIAAGNSAVLKPSAYSPATSAIIHEIIAECFLPDYIAVVEGGREENTELLNEHFDYIFFTGSQSVGKLVLRKAAKFITPVTLELGGKSPCIVDASADIKLAARRIVFGKYLNLGQTCVAPDYLLVDNKIKEELLHCLKSEIIRQFGEHPLDNPDYGHIVNQKHFERLCKLYHNEKIYWGGATDQNLRIEPTIISDVALKSPLMKQEIFGPLLPVIGYDSLDDAFEIINLHPTPLALYLFTTNDKTKKLIFSSIRFGGGCVNDTIMHLTSPKLGFGGIGLSGMGAYHGKAGFDTFTHYKSVVDKGKAFDLPIRYQPYKEQNCRLLHRFLK
mgnify:FL=1